MTGVLGGVRVVDGTAWIDEDSASVSVDVTEMTGVRMTGVRGVAVVVTVVFVVVNVATFISGGIPILRKISRLVTMSPGGLLCIICVCSSPIVLFFVVVVVVAAAFVVVVAGKKPILKRFTLEAIPYPHSCSYIDTKHISVLSPGYTKALKRLIQNQLKIVCKLPWYMYAGGLLPWYVIYSLWLLNSFSHVYTLTYMIQV